MNEQDFGIPLTLRVFCARCGREMSLLDVSLTRIDSELCMAVDAEPCEQCLDEEHEEAFSKGYEEGYQVGETDAYEKTKRR